MNCPECAADMVPGKAFKPNLLELTYRVTNVVPTLLPDEIEIVDCDKCPKCGYSAADYMFTNTYIKAHR